MTGEGASGILPPRREGDTTTPTTSKALRTRARLLEAAVEAFGELGFEQATMDDIAVRAQVAHGTVYRYFANKEAILYAVVAEKLTRLAEEAREALADPALGAPVAIRRFLAHVSANRGLARIWSELIASRSSAADLRRRLRAPFIESITAVVRQAQLEGCLPADVDVDVAARAMGAMVDNFAHVWFVMEDRPADEAELDRLTETLSTLWAGALGSLRQGGQEPRWLASAP